MFSDCINMVLVIGLVGYEIVPSLVSIGSVTRDIFSNRQFYNPHTTEKPLIEQIHDIAADSTFATKYPPKDFENQDSRLKILENGLHFCGPPLLYGSLIRKR